ncbi:uncharacterized protein [Penaeus vannamei]|uniref:uncharacterized protein n=1 Tax=Penaeus vannamei TaxID=6689 RepID=UPI00387FA3D3
MQLWHGLLKVSSSKNKSSTVGRIVSFVFEASLRNPSPTARHDEDGRVDLGNKPLPGAGPTRDRIAAGKISESAGRRVRCLPSQFGRPDQQTFLPASPAHQVRPQLLQPPPALPPTVPAKAPVQSLLVQGIDPCKWKAL